MWLFYIGANYPATKRDAPGAWTEEPDTNSSIAGSHLCEFPEKVKLYKLSSTDLKLALRASKGQSFKNVTERGYSC